MDRRIRTGLSFLVLAAPFLLAACGGGGGGGVAQPPGATAVDVLWVVPDNTIASAEVITAFGADNLYYNAHTTANPNGEIRGQLDTSGTVKFATLDGAQETPPVTTSAFGGGALSLDTVTGRVSGFVVTSGLVGVTNAHVHNAARGIPGGVVIPLAGGPDIWVVPDNTIASPEVIAAFAADNLYYNVHTSANPNGEIRGQLDATGTVKLANLDGAQETPPVTTSALGGGALSLDTVTSRVGGFVVTSGLVNVTNAHVHNAARGTPGGVVIPLAGGPDLWVVPDNTIASPEVIAAFPADNLYYNVHTSANPNGEIRGQLDASGPARFTALDGDQEAPDPVVTLAFGGGVFSLDGATGRAAGFIATSGLVSPTAAHVHNGARGVAGPVVIPLLTP